MREYQDVSNANDQKCGILYLFLGAPSWRLIFRGRVERVCCALGRPSLSSKYRRSCWKCGILLDIPLCWSCQCLFYTCSFSSCSPLFTFFLRSCNFGFDNGDNDDGGGCGGDCSGVRGCGGGGNEGERKQTCSTCLF